MEEADEELGLEIVFKKKTYTFEGTWEKINQLHDLIRGQLDVLSIGNEELQVATSGALRSTLLGHSPSASELGVGQVSSYMQDKGGSFKQSLTSLNQDDKFQSRKTNILMNDPEDSASLSSSRKNAPEKNIVTKTKHDIETDEAEEFTEEQGQRSKIHEHVVSDDTNNTGSIESHESIQRENSHSSMPSLEACTVVDDTGEEEKFDLTLTEEDHITSGDVIVLEESFAGKKQYKSNSIQGVHVKADESTNNFSSQHTASMHESKPVSDDMQSSFAQLEEEYAAAKQTKSTEPSSTESSKRYVDDQLNTDTHNKDIKMERMLNSYQNGSFDMYDCNDTRAIDIAFPEEDEDACEQYVDPTVWAYVQKVYRHKLQQYEHEYKVSYQCKNEDQSDDIQMVIITARSVDADKAMASEALCQLIATTQQECSMQMVKVARLIVYEKCVEAIRELGENYPDIEIKDNFKIDRQFLFIGGNDEAVAASKQFKRVIGMLPPPEKPIDFKYRRRESPSGLRHKEDMFTDIRDEIPKDLTYRRGESPSGFRHEEEDFTDMREEKTTDETKKSNHDADKMEIQAGELNKYRHNREKTAEEIAHISDDEELTQNKMHRVIDLPKRKDENLHKEDSFSHVDMKFNFKFDEADAGFSPNGKVKLTDELNGIHITTLQRKPEKSDSDLEKEKVVGKKLDVAIENKKVTMLDNTTLKQSENYKIPSVNFQQHLQIKPPTYNLDKEIESITLSKQQSSTVKLLFELLENPDPGDNIEEVIDQILSGRSADDTDGGFFKENLFPEYKHTEVSPDTKFECTLDSPVVRAASSSKSVPKTKNTFEDEHNTKDTNNVDTSHLNHSAAEKLDSDQNQFVPPHKMSKSASSGVKLDEDYFGEKGEKSSKVDKQSTTSPDQHGQEMTKQSAHERKLSHEVKEETSSDTEVNPDKWLMSRLEHSDDSKIKTSSSGYEINESLTMKNENITIHVNTDNSSIQKEPSHNQEVLERVKPFSLNDGSARNMDNGVVVPPNKKVAHGTIMSESFFGEEPAGPSSMHSDKSSVSEDEVVAEVVEPLKVKKAVYQPPDGIMHRLIDKKYHLSGHENEGTQLVTFKFKQGRQEADGPKPRETFNGAHVTCIIPNGLLGKSIYKLMKEAFDKRKLFTIEQLKGDNCITPRVYFKSDKTEYPAEKYLQSLKAALELIIGK